MSENFDSRLEALSNAIESNNEKIEKLERDLEESHQIIN